MTTLSPKRSTAFKRPRSSIDEDRGETPKPWSSPLWNGSIGSTTDAFLSPSATYRQPRSKSDITPCWTRQPWPDNLNQTVSGKAGAVQCCGAVLPWAGIRLIKLSTSWAHLLTPVAIVHPVEITHAAVCRFCPFRLMGSQFAAPKPYRRKLPAQGQVDRKFHS